MIYGARFPHARLTDQQGGFAGKVRAQGFNVDFGRHGQHGVADVFEFFEADFRFFKLRQIFFVEHDNRRDARCITGHQTQAQKGFAESGPRGDDDHCLIDIGGQCFFAEGIGTKQYIAARMNLINTAIAGRGDGYFDLVTAGDVLFFAFTHAGKRGVVGQLD